MSCKKCELEGWYTRLYGDSLEVSLDGAAGVILITATDEGFVVDIQTDDEERPSVDSASALYSELERED